jgi:glycosyltransferase involved in cell wall biosynthesis
MEKNNILFLIRAYNESSRIIQVIDSIFQAGFHQILVVDDGSTDGTRSLLEGYYGEDIRIVRHMINRGGGAALETGFEYIRRHHHKSWEYVVTFDADGQHDILDIDKFIGIFDTHPHTDIVYGSRFITKTSSNVPWVRRMILW